MDYGTEPGGKPREGQRLLKRIAHAVAWFATLAVIGLMALDATDGQVIAQTIPGPSSDLVYVEGGCPIRWEPAHLGGSS